MASYPPPVELSAKRIRVLHVEDNDVDALVVQTLLSRQNYARTDLTRAKSLMEARRRLDEERFDLILLDLNLPDAAKLAGLRALQPEKPDTPPVIVLTSEDYQESGIQSLQAGAQDFLAKARLGDESLARAILNAYERRRLETALRRERDLARQYLDIVPVIIVALDLDGRITLLNRTGCETLGVCERDILGKEWIGHFVHEEDRGKVRGFFEEALRGEDAPRERLENRILGLNGESLLISWRNSLMRDDSGKVAGILSSGEDISEKRRAEEEILALSRFPEENPNLVMRLSKEGVFSYANPAGRKYLEKSGLAIGATAPEAFCAAADQARASGESWTFDMQLKQRMFRFLVSAAPGEDYVNIYGQDVTESDNALKKMEESERAHRVIFENSPLGMIYLDGQGNMTKWNRKFLEIMGASEESYAGFNVFENVSDKRMRDATRRAIGGEYSEFEDVYTSVAGGRTLHLRARFNPINPGDSPTEVIAAFEDVTESKLAQMKVKDIQERLEMALEAAGIGMWDWFVQTGEVVFDARWRRMLGFSPGELPGKVSFWEDLMHPEDKPGVMETLRRHHAGLTEAYQAEYRLRTKSGNWKWILALGKVIERDEKERPVRMTGIHLDIDERMRLSEERDWDIKVKDALSRLYMRLTAPKPDLASVSIELLEEAKTLIGAHSGFCATVGRESEDIENRVYAESSGQGCGVEGVKSLDLSPGKDGRYPGLWGNALNTGEAFYANAPSAHPSSSGLPPGHMPLVNFLAVPVFFGDRLAGLIALANKECAFTSRDLAAVREMGRYYAVAMQRVEALDELSRSEERYRTLVESMQEGIFMIDQEGALTYVNHQVCKMLGRSRQDIMGKKLSEFVDESRRDDFLAQQDKRKEGFAERYDLIFKHVEGHKIFTLIAPTPLFDGAGEFQGSFGVVTNVTKLKLLENQLVQAQKLESIGQLAAGIAHEINTPTQYVDNNVRYIKEGLDTLLGIARRCQAFVGATKAGKAARDEDLRELATLLETIDVAFLSREMPEAVDDALEGLERIAEIVRSVKQLAHPGKPEMELVDINEAVQSAVTVSRNEWKYAADLETDFDTSLPLVMCIRGEFNQVILNLIINASQAIQEKLGERPEGRGRIWVSTKNTGDGVEIRVKDSGGGVPKAIQDKIFDPFFTTKEVGKGTGQGLAISYNVIREKHGGEIALESEEGQGAVFIVRLPFERGKSKGAA